jgi:hypothetical protein
VVLLTIDFFISQGQNITGEIKIPEPILIFDPTIMVVNIAFTSPVNHADLKPLSAADVWAGIVLTVRRPEDFVDYISRTEILEDTGASLKRILHFVEGGVHNAPGGKLDQTVSIFPDFKVNRREKPSYLQALTA